MGTWVERPSRLAAFDPETLIRLPVLANPWPSFYLDDHVQGIGDIGLNREVRYLDATLQDAGRKS
jgi:hypothetical protein